MVFEGDCLVPQNRVWEPDKELLMADQSNLMIKLAR
jgi:hypothetical protein